MAARPPPADVLALILGLGAAAWIPISLWPDGGMPAWPAASLGILALALAARPGRALPRGLGAFLGLAGLVIGGLQIAALWAAAEVIP